MNSNSIPFFRYAAVAGLAIGFIENLYSIISIKVGFYNESWSSLLSLLLSLGMYFYALYRYRSIYYATDAFRFGRGIKVGLVIGVVSALLSWITFILFIQNEMSDLAMQTINEKLLEARATNPQVSTIDMNKIKSIIEWMYSPVPYLILALIGGFISGFFKALISMIFLMRNK